MKETQGKSKNMEVMNAGSESEAVHSSLVQLVLFYNPVNSLSSEQSGHQC